jgi:hypothetical protein
MKFNKIILVTFYLLLSIKVSYSYSSNDSINTVIDSTAVSYYTINIDSIFIPKTFDIDTCLDGVQKYNPLNKWHQYYASLGNTGLAYNSILFNQVNTIGFDYGLHSFDKYRFTFQKTEYFNSLLPYTELFYVMGRNREHYFKVTHSQNIRTNLSVGAKFRIINSPGFYTNHKSNNSSVVFNTHFFSKNKRYQLYANFIHNGIKVQENGGIENDSSFDYNLETNRHIIEVNLNDANRRYKESVIFLQNSYKLSNDIKSKKDTNYSKTRLSKAFSSGNISHTFIFNRKIIAYEDGNPAAGFYPTINFDSLQTHDSTAILTMENKFFWANFENYNEKENFLNAAFGITLRNIYLHNDSTDYRINQVAISAKAAKSIFKKFIIYVDGEYIFGDYNNEDHFLRGQANWMIGKNENTKKLLSFKIGYYNSKPGWIYQRYYSNNFIWNNDLGKQQTFISELSFKMKNFITSLHFYNISSFLYFNTSALPDQHSGSFSILTASIFKKFIAGKVNFDNEIVYQYDGGTDVLHLPDLILNHSVYFNLDLFKHAVSTQTGIDIYYNTAYYSNAYMPATGIFYLQNEKETGNYPYADIFVNVKIKKAMIFAKYEHINKGLFDYKYYMIPHYPMPDGAFKFGVKWKFFN